MSTYNERKQNAFIGVSSMKNACRVPSNPGKWATSFQNTANVALSHDKIPVDPVKATRISKGILLALFGLYFIGWLVALGIGFYGSYGGYIVSIIVSNYLFLGLFFIPVASLVGTVEKWWSFISAWFAAILGVLIIFLEVVFVIFLIYQVAYTSFADAFAPIPWLVGALIVWTVVMVIVFGVTIYIGFKWLARVYNMDAFRAQVPSLGRNNENGLIQGNMKADAETRSNRFDISKKFIIVTLCCYHVILYIISLVFAVVSTLVYETYTETIIWVMMFNIFIILYGFYHSEIIGYVKFQRVNSIPYIILIALHFIGTAIFQGFQIGLDAMTWSEWIHADTPWIAWTITIMSFGGLLVDIILIIYLILQILIRKDHMDGGYKEQTRTRVLAANMYNSSNRGCGGTRTTY